MSSIPSPSYHIISTNHNTAHDHLQATNKRKMEEQNHELNHNLPLPLLTLTVSLPPLLRWRNSTLCFKHHCSNSISLLQSCIAGTSLPSRRRISRWREMCSVRWTHACGPEKEQQQNTQLVDDGGEGGGMWQRRACSARAAGVFGMDAQ